MVKDLIARLADVDDVLRTSTAPYFNTRVFFNVRDDKAKVQVPFDINDFFELGAITNSDLLLAGKTGKGKSHASRMVMNGLYGEKGFENLTVTPGLNESDFIDIDIEAARTGKKTLKEAITHTPLLTRPGVIINEINRTPEILQNIFISYIERIFSLKGVEFPVGVAIGQGPNNESPQSPHYQFRMISINEGQEYQGTSGIDSAVRDRVPLEIPMDIFKPTKNALCRNNG